MTNKKDNTIQVGDETPVNPIETVVSDVIEEKSTKGLDNPLDKLYNLPTEDRDFTEASKFEIPEEYKDPRFVYGFPLVSDISKKQRNGWHIYTKDMSAGLGEGRVGSSLSFFGSLNDDLKEVGHILMIIRKDQYEKELRHIQKQTDRQEESIKVDAKKIKGNYGEITKEDGSKIKL
jgi:hypothetical protein